MLYVEWDGHTAVIQDKNGHEIDRYDITGIEQLLIKHVTGE